MNQVLYRILPIDALQQLKLQPAFFLCVLYFKSDFKTGHSDVLRETLAELTHCHPDTVSKWTDQLASLGFLHKRPYRVKSADGKWKNRNEYILPIPEKDFIMVNEDFLDLRFEGLDEKVAVCLKGFLLKLKAACLNNSNDTLYTLEELAKAMGICRSTVQKYMGISKKLGIVDKLEGGYRIKLRCFDKGNCPTLPKGTPKAYREAYREIDRFCRSMQLPTPKYERKYIAQLLARYPESEEQLRKTGDAEFVERHSLRAQLYKRLGSIKKPVRSLKYVVKALTNKDIPEPGEKPATEYIM